MAKLIVSGASGTNETSIEQARIIVDIARAVLFAAEEALKKANELQLSVALASNDARHFTRLAAGGAVQSAG